jgi:hypothetical protein
MLAAAFTRATLRSHVKYGYAAVSFGSPVALDELVADPAGVARLPDAERRPILAKVADSLLARVSTAIPATPVALVSRALLDGVTDVPSLRRHVREQIVRIRTEGRMLAEGRAYAGIGVGRAKLTGIEPEKDDLDRDILDGEEAEITVDLALRLLKRRKVVRAEGPRLHVGDGDRALLAYYARSLDTPVAKAERPVVSSSA